MPPQIPESPRNGLTTIFAAFTAKEEGMGVKPGRLNYIITSVQFQSFIIKIRERDQNRGSTKGSKS